MEDNEEVIIEIRVKGTLEKAQDYADALSESADLVLQDLGLELLPGIAVYKAELVNKTEDDERRERENADVEFTGGIDAS